MNTLAIPLPRVPLLGCFPFCDHILVGATIPYLDLANKHVGNEQSRKGLLH